LPLLTTRLLGKNVAIGGGGYLRLLPVSIVLGGIARENRAGEPAVLYLHPWELDPEQPRHRAGAVSTFRHYVGLAGTEGKLRRVLRDRRPFETLRAVVEALEDRERRSRAPRRD
jgi:hypothetical protein